MSLIFGSVKTEVGGITGAVTLLGLRVFCLGLPFLPDFFCTLRVCSLTVADRSYRSTYGLRGYDLMVMRSCGMLMLVFFSRHSKSFYNIKRLMPLLGVLASMYFRSG